MTTRAFHELSPFECVLAVADRYDVEVVMLPSRGTWSRPRGAQQGPAGHFTKAHERRVFIESSVHDPLSAASELHEVVHCIAVPPRESARVFVPEHYGLLQFELALAHVVFAHCPRQLEDVRAYQGITFVDKRRRVGDWPRYERTRWWRTGLALMKRIGLLDARNRPTWKRGSWPSVDELRVHARECDESVRLTPDPA